VPGQTREELPADEVHVWHLDPERLDAAALDRCLALASDEERRQAQRFRVESPRRLHLAARALARTCLARYTCVEPRGWRLEAGRWGRPEIAGPPGYGWLRFNLSHTRGRVVCALARDAWVGVDVEDTGRGGRLLDVAHRYFAPAEVEELFSLPEPARVPRFFDYWTLKEAYIKARGMGLALPLSQFAFRLGIPGPIRAEFDAALGDDPEAWQFERLRWPPHHEAALAVRRGRGAERRLVVRAVDPARGFEAPG
jgi:4'-phosphopantetheinyl transferase